MSCDYPVCSTLTNPKARKEHKCYECRGTIFKGEKYYNFSGIWSGEGPDRYKFCPNCWALRVELSTEEDFAFGELCEAADQDAKTFYRFAINHVHRNKTPWPWIVERLQEEYKDEYQEIQL